MKTRTIFALCVVALALWACHEPGPAERLGKRVDAATGNDEREAQLAGRDIDKAVEDVRDDARKAREDLEKE